MDATQIKALVAAATVEQRNAKIDERNVLIISLDIPATDEHCNFTGELCLTPAKTPEGRTRLYLRPCDRCGGAGILHEYKGIFGGVCFECNGGRYAAKTKTLAGHTRLLRSRAVSAIKADAERRTAAEAHGAAKDRAQEEIFAANPELPLILAEMDSVIAEAARTVRAVDPQFTNLLAARKIGLKWAYELRSKLNNDPAQFSAEQFMEAWQEFKTKNDRTFYGAIGELVTVTGTVTMIRGFENRFGWSNMIKMTVGSAPITIFSSARWADTVEEGEEITVTGTVKEHEEHETYGRSTVLARVKLAA